MDIFERSVEYHRKLGGKLELHSKAALETQDDLSLVYTPGVAGVCEAIVRDPDLVYDLTIKRNTVAIVTDGSAVLGLGNIGAQAALPVMEGKALLFKKYAGIDAFPICLRTQDTEEIIKICRNIAPGFGGINLEDIAAPRCFEIEERLQNIGIPVFHDDQHGTAIVLLAALLNAVQLAGKKMCDLRIVINGAGAAGTSIAHLLMGLHDLDSELESVGEVLICDSRGIISRNRMDIDSNPAKTRLALETNRENLDGTLIDAIRDCDIFIGVSKANLLTAGMIHSMRAKPIVFALANPIPEIMPDVAEVAGVFIIGTGRSDFDNQVNNVLAFPGIFRGAIDMRATRISGKMKVAAARALANFVKEPTVNHIIPSPLEEGVGAAVAEAVRAAGCHESTANV